jgi:hypothetical protein
MHIRWDHDLTGAVPIQIADRGVIIENPMSIATVDIKLGSAGAQCPGMLINPGIGPAADCCGHDEFQGAVRVQVINGQAAQFVGGRSFRPASLKISLGVVYRDIAAVMSGRNLKLAVPIDIRDDDTGSGAPDVVRGVVGFAAVVSRIDNPLQVVKFIDFLPGAPRPLPQIPTLPRA